MRQQPITTLLHAWNGGDQEALAIVTPLVHSELRQMARRHMPGERAAHSLQVTGLVNECYLRLANAQRMQCQDRMHFLAWASRLMRQILVDFARDRQAAKRGSRVQHVPLAERTPPRKWVATSLALDDALGMLARIDERR